MYRCLPAVLIFLELQNDVESAGLLSALKYFKFLFGVEFLMALFMSANAASEALQSSDTDLAAAAHAVEMLIEFASNMRTEEEFVRIVAAASKICKKIRRF